MHLFQRKPQPVQVLPEVALDWRISEARQAYKRRVEEEDRLVKASEDRRIAKHNASLRLYLCPVDNCDIREFHTTPAIRYYRCHLHDQVMFHTDIRPNEIGAMQ